MSIVYGHCRECAEFRTVSKDGGICTECRDMFTILTLRTQIALMNSELENYKRYYRKTVATTLTNAGSILSCVVNAIAEFRKAEEKRKRDAEPF